MDQPHPYKKPYPKQDLMTIASCCTCVSCRKRWISRTLRSKTAKACSSWLGCKIKASALLRAEQSLTTYLHHEMPSLTCRRSLMVFFVSSHTKKDTRALPQQQTTDLQNHCELLALSSGDRSGAGLPLALGLLSTAYPLFQLHTTLPPPLPPFSLLPVTCFLHPAFLRRCLKCR